MSKKLAGLTIVAIAIALAGVAAAEEKPAAPKPGPEIKKLEYFVGKWKSEGETKPNPFMPGGKFQTKDNCTWFEGGFAVVCESEGKGPMGAMKGLGVMSYSAEEKVYTYWGLDNMGMVMATVPRGTVEGDTWTYTDESKMGGKAVKSRFVMQQKSPTSYTFKWEMEGEGGSWVTLMEGKATKAS